MGPPFLPGRPPPACYATPTPRIPKSGYRVPCTRPSQSHPGTRRAGRPKAIPAGSSFRASGINSCSFPYSYYLYHRFLFFTCTGGPCTLVCDREGTEPETGFHPGFGSPTNLQGKDTVMPMKISDTDPTPPGLFHPAAMRPSDSLHGYILRSVYPRGNSNRKLDGCSSQDIVARIELIRGVTVGFSGSTLPAPFVKSSV